MRMTVEQLLKFLDKFTSLTYAINEYTTTLVEWPQLSSSVSS